MFVVGQDVALTIGMRYPVERTAWATLWVEFGTGCFATMRIANVRLQCSHAAEKFAVDEVAIAEWALQFDHLKSLSVADDGGVLRFAGVKDVSVFVRLQPVLGDMVTVHGVFGARAFGRRRLPTKSAIILMIRRDATVSALASLTNKWTSSHGGAGFNRLARCHEWLKRCRRGSPRRL